jgi:hypothetical protein
VVTGETVTTISREELQAIHRFCKGKRPRPGSEAFSLMCVVGCCLTNWPRVRAEKAAEVRKRFRALQRPDGRNDAARRASPPSAEAAGAIAAFVAGLMDLPDATAVIALPGNTAPTGLTLGHLRRIARQQS